MSTRLTNKGIRNIAIIAHVDHGKTSLVDQLFRQSGTFRDNQNISERVMDRGDIERERGITISAKNCSIHWKDIKINIIDTPGHADFGGEVERALSMADGAILLVDASEGPLPQTRFVLNKALSAGLKIVVVINKIDRPDARIDEVVHEVGDLFLDIAHHEGQLEYPILYAIGRSGIAKLRLEDETDNLTALLDTIINYIPAPSFDPEKPFQMLISDLDYSDYLGRLCIGRIINGSVKAADQLVRIGEQATITPLKVTKIQTYQGISIAETPKADCGEIIILSGVDNVKIGDTIATASDPRALPRLSVDEPTVSINFYRNNGPFAGQEGKWVALGKVLERLQKEALRNVAIKVEESIDRGSICVKGRGEFQLAIIIESLRREGYEFCVARPQVIYHNLDGKKQEPIESLYIECGEEYTGAVTEKLLKRKCLMTNMIHHGSKRALLEFSAPSRSLIGYRDEFLTDTKGTGIMNSIFSGYEDYRGDIPGRASGSLVADRQGEAIPYAIFNLEPRGKIFVLPNDKIYEGMIIGEHNRENDLNVNISKEKKLSNMRAAGKDDNIILTPFQPLTLESCLSFLRDDEWLEVTPSTLRMRKAALKATDRKLWREEG